VERPRGILLLLELASSMFLVTPPQLQPKVTSLVSVLPLPLRTYNEKTFYNALTFFLRLGVVALVVIALMSVSWIYLYRRAYGSALPVSVPVQQRTPLLYQPAGAQASSWNF